MSTSERLTPEEQRLILSQFTKGVEPTFSVESEPVIFDPFIVKDGEAQIDPLFRLSRDLELVRVHSQAIETEYRKLARLLEDTQLDFAIYRRKSAAGFIVGILLGAATCSFIFKLF